METRSGEDKSLTCWSSIASRPRACVHKQRPRSQDLISVVFITAQKKQQGQSDLAIKQLHFISEGRIPVILIE